MQRPKLKVVFSMLLIILNLMAAQLSTAMIMDAAVPTATASEKISCHEAAVETRHSTHQAQPDIHQHGCCKAGGCSCPAISAVTLTSTLLFPIASSAVDEDIVGSFSEHCSREAGLPFKPPI
jgi:hypothetical protein